MRMWEVRSPVRRVVRTWTGWTTIQTDRIVKDRERKTGPDKKTRGHESRLSHQTVLCVVKGESNPPGRILIPTENFRALLLNSTLFDPSLLEERLDHGRRIN